MYAFHASRRYSLTLINSRGRSPMSHRTPDDAMNTSEAVPEDDAVGTGGEEEMEAEEGYSKLPWLLYSGHGSLTRGPTSFLLFSHSLLPFDSAVSRSGHPSPLNIDSLRSTLSQSHIVSTTALAS